MRLHVLMGALVGLQILIGCGTSPATSRPQRVTTFEAPPPPTQLPGPLPTAGAVGDVQVLRSQVAAAHAQVPGLLATLDTFDKGPSAQEQNTIRITYRKPYTMKIEMVKASGTAQGARILWTGGDTLRVKPSFLPLAVEKRIDDAQTVSKNGWTIRHTGVHAIFKVLLDPAAQVRAYGRQVMEGRPVDTVEVRSAQSPTGITREIFGIDPVSRLPVVRAAYRGDALVYRVLIRSMSVKAVSESEISL